MRRGQHGAARELLARIAAASPAHPAALFLLGVVDAEMADFASAVAHIDRAFAAAPAQAAANRLVFANILLDAGLPARAEAETRQALQDAPGAADASNLLGAALYRQGRVQEALEAYSAAAGANPAYAPAHLNLALTLAELGRVAEAIESQRRVVALQPASAVDHFRLGHLFHRHAHVFDAIESFRAALALDATHADWWVHLANALTDAGLLAEARDAYRKALQLRPGYHEVESTLLVNLHYDTATGRDAMLAAHRAWAARHASGVPQVARPSIAPRSRLRVAFLSPAVKSGPTGSFLAPLLRHLDRQRFETSIYNANGTRDDFSARLAALVDHWVDFRGEDDEAMARRIAADGIDALVDLAGHTPGGRPLVLARCPAPAIVSWLDYFDTTAIPGVEYLIGDSISTPAADADRFTERVVPIDPCRLVYEPPAYAPEVCAPPFARNGFITFGSFNRISKVTRPVLASWARVMHAVPNSRLLLKSPAFADPRMCGHVRALLAGHGIEAARIDLRAHSPHAAMLAEYGDMDIALDTFPYNGGITTCEALWMGVPVVAWLGDSMISRQSAALLEAAGMQEWVAADADDFVKRAEGLANDASQLAALRSGMRAKLARSPLVDGAAFARKFEAAIARVRSA
jgi:predicted O-linked N-acetylglucosamine transferase (SPINDLY family)